ncbi:vWA domain-containing protein [Enterococcus sp. CWB-B31]|uniref:vWA domain-containing protein n=1 Tax=Enterococcus sp. CWB-B31 TaxID=2885159 RepID=UPI001E4EAF3A|nr:vWA domain-containing protein [Enterococcus sp. CWB-B31]MCB5954249.1 VWA domain-containing protein [Enterococcus sp. CWB-B31]
MKKIKILLVITFLSSLFSCSSLSYAEEKSGQDILFVVDISYSMAAHDPGKHVFEAVQTMASISSKENDRMGYILYNDSIVKDQQLTKIQGEGMLAQWQNVFAGITPIKGTDVGLGLKTAQRIMKISQARKDRSMIILLSDGDTEADSGNPNRLQEDIDRDVRNALDALESPLYIIQYSELEYRNKEPMNQWAEQTGGQSYTAQNQQELKQIVTDIYNHQTTVSAKIDQENEKKQKETFTFIVPVPADELEKIEQITVTMNAEKAIENLTYEENEKTLVENKENQVVITLYQPIHDDYTFSYQTAANKPAKISTDIKMAETAKKSTKTKKNDIVFYSFIGGLILLITGGIAFILFRRKNQLFDKNADYFFADALEGCFTKTPNQEDIPIQNWSANIFQRQKTVTLYDLLYEETIREQMPVSRKVQFKVGKENTLKMRIKGKVKGIQQGREIPKGVWVTLSVRQGAYLIFKEDELELDIHIRKKSS